MVDKENEHQDRKAKFHKELNETQDNTEKQALMDRYAQYEKDVEAQLKSLADEGQKSIEDRLKERRNKRKEEREELLKKQKEEEEQNVRDLQDQLKREADEIRDGKEDQTIEEIVKVLKKELPQDEVPQALEKILDDRHMRELLDLLMKQYKEKSKALKDEILKLYEEKAAALKKLKNEFEPQKAMLKEAYEKGGISEKQLTEELDIIKEKEEQRKEDIEEEFKRKERSAEQDVKKRLIEKHTEEQIELEEKQQEERRKYFESLLPDSVLKRIMQEGQDLLDGEISDFRREKMEEKAEKIRELEAKMAALREGMGRHKGELNDLDEIERRLREKEAIAEGKFDIQKRKLIDRKEREQRAQ